jgi:signal transduction histidine kinase
MNAIEAMRDVTDRPGALRISSGRDESNDILIAIEDSGVGLNQSIVDHIFDALFTTKPDGMGRRLSICRSVVEAHGGRLWCSPRSPYGSIFRFTLPQVPLASHQHLDLRGVERRSRLGDEAD